MLTRFFKFILILGSMVIAVPLFQAFEAHIVNVTAELALIEPPIITNDQDPNTAFVIAQDPDATHVYYTVGSGIDPVCGDVNGGPKEGVYSEDVSSDTIIKAIACDGDTSNAHHSIITTEVFIQEPVIEFAPEEIQGLNIETEEEALPEETPPPPEEQVIEEVIEGN